MSSSVYLKFPKEINYYDGLFGVQIVFDGSEITVSTFHCASGNKLAQVAWIAKKIRSKYDGTYECDPELSVYMPKEFLTKEEEI
jgi:hypothetical protein